MWYDKVSSPEKGAESLMLESAQKLLEESSTLHLGVLGAEGYPLIYPMEKVGTIALKKVFFLIQIFNKKLSFVELKLFI